MTIFHPIRRLYVLAGTALLLAIGGVLSANAQDYPNQTIKIVVPFVAGGGVDVVARIIAPRLGEALGQSVIIENKGGAGGMLGAPPWRSRRPTATRSCSGPAARMEPTPAYIPSSAMIRSATSCPSCWFRRLRFCWSCPLVAGKVRQRIDRAGAQPAGRAQFRLVRHRQHQSSRRRALQFDGGNPGEPHPLSRGGSGDDRSDRRPAPLHVRRRVDVARLRPGRHDPGAGRGRPRPLAGPSRSAHDLGIGRSRIRHRRSGSGCSLRRGRPKPIVDLDEPQDERRPGLAEHQGKLREARHRRWCGGGRRFSPGRCKSEMQKWANIVREKNIRIDQ